MKLVPVPVSSRKLENSAGLDTSGFSRPPGIASEWGYYFNRPNTSCSYSMGTRSKALLEAPYLQFKDLNSHMLFATKLPLVPVSSRDPKIHQTV
jgi:hypothetical protein